MFYSILFCTHYCITKTYFNELLGCGIVQLSKLSVYLLNIHMNIYV